jgi:WD40 repeat protein
MQKLVLSLWPLMLAGCATPTFHLKSSEVSMKLKTNAWSMQAVAFSPDGKYAFSGDMHSMVSVWDLAVGRKIETLQISNVPAGSGLSTLVFHPHGQYLVTGQQGNGRIEVWDITRWTRIAKIAGFGWGGSVATIAFSPNGDRMFAGGVPGVGAGFGAPFTFKEWDTPTWKKTRELVTHAESEGRSDRFGVITAVSRDGRYAVHKTLLDRVGQIALWNVETGRQMWAVRTMKTAGRYGGVTKAMTGGSSLLHTAVFSPDERTLMSAEHDAVRLRDTATGGILKEFPNPAGNVIYALGFSPDGKYALGGGEDAVRLWDVESGMEAKTYVGHTGKVLSVAFSPDGKHILSAGDDASARMWNVETGEEVATMIQFRDGEWIITTPNGYYSASEKGDQYLQVKVGGKDYTIEQLRESFYRPDLVKAALSGGSLSGYRQLADVKQPPTVSIINTPSSVRTAEVDVTLRIVDTGGGIGNVRLYNNGSAVMADNSRGIKINQTGGENAVTKSYVVKLVNGVNALKAIAFNGDNTMQSEGAVFQITASLAAAAKPSLHALVIGINDYKNPKLQLNYAVADAKLFAETLKQGAAGMFDGVDVKFLSTGDETSSENIIQELKAMRRLNPDDLFVFYVASHATVDEGEYFLITSNVGSTRIERLRTDAVSQTVLKELLANIPATKKFIVIDTCNAGALGEALQTTVLSRGMSEDTAMKILSRSVGSTILSASTSLQEALEGYNGHGLFTYVLSEGLGGKADKGKTGYVKTTELADYVDNEVPVLAEKVFKRAQYPTISISGQAFPIGKTR